MSEKKTKIKLPSLSKVKKALHDDWALRVKQRDGHKCLLCGTDALLTAHHWFYTRQRGKAARYCTDNGATLCFTCHIREVHKNPGYAVVNDVRHAVMAKSPNFDEDNIRALKNVELTTEILRTLWDGMRARPTRLPPGEFLVVEKGGKLFFTVPGDRQFAVVGNTVLTGRFGLCEVTVVSRDADGIRYTLRRLET